MKIKNLFLCLFLVVLPMHSSAHLHFIRKVIALAAGCGVAYKFPQSVAQDVVKAFNAEWKKMDLPFHTKFTDSQKFNNLVKYPAYGVRGISGMLTFVILNSVLNHE